MNAAHKIVVLVGSIFLAVGVFVGIIFAIVAEPGKFPLAMLSLPGSFLLIGGGMDIVVAILVHNKKMIVKKGVGESNPRSFLFAWITVHDHVLA